MIPENHKLIDAFYNNNERTTVETTWEDNEDGVIRVYYIDAVNGNPDWAKLLTHITIDEMHDNTIAKIREERERFEQVVLQIANKDGINVDDILSDENETIDFIFDWFDGSFNNEKLFKVKLRLFERDKVINSKDTKLKANLRKATTLLQIMEAYSKF